LYLIIISSRDEDFFLKWVFADVVCTWSRSFKFFGTFFLLVSGTCAIKGVKVFFLIELRLGAVVAGTELLRNSRFLYLKSIALYDNRHSV
jgi:hypothetical protein